MRIAITGGTGFIGRHLAKRLCDEGHQVVLVARGKNRGKKEKFDISFVASDLSDVAVLARDAGRELRLPVARGERGGEEGEDDRGAGNLAEPHVFDPLDKSSPAF